MPFIGIGLHVLIALFFAVHALRSGQPIYWLFILFSFPLLGSVVYFLVIYLPNSRLEHGARKVVAAAAKSFDPSKELREARSAFDYAPTAQNQMRLAAALLDAGDADEAAANYEACLKGPFASDPEIRLGAARAYIASARWSQAIAYLETLRKTDPNFRSERITLLLAQALAGAGRSDEAKAAYASALDRYGSFESRVEYAIWAASSGDAQLAEQLRVDVVRSMERWSRHTRAINKDLIRRFEAAYAGARNKA